jgi:hypothetical protein
MTFFALASPKCGTSDALAADDSSAENNADDARLVSNPEVFQINWRRPREQLIPASLMLTPSPGSRQCT